MPDLNNHIRDARQGNLRAFGYVASRFYQMAVGYAFSILRDYHLAEDVAQESFIHAFKNLEQLKNAAAFPGWFRRIVFTQCDRKTRRKQLPILPIEFANSKPGTSESPAARVERLQLEEAVRAAISRLDVPDRTVITLFYIKDQPISEIAEFLEVPESTVKSRLHTARNTMKMIITQSFVELVPEGLQSTTPQRSGQMYTKMFPELHVSEVETSIDFFEDALGFKTAFKSEPEDGIVDFAVLQHGDFSLYLHHMLPDEEAQRPKRMRLYLELQDIASVHAELLKKDYSVSEIHQHTYGAGAKTCTLVAPDQYEIVFQQWLAR